MSGCVKDSTIRIRQGPGTEFDVIGGLVSGTCVTIVGRNKDASWVYMVTADNLQGWVAAWLLTVDGNLNRVSVQKDTNVSVSVSPTMRVVSPLKTNTPRPVIIQPTAKNNNCSPSYPTVCIPPPPPDLDCKDIPYKRFTVTGSDPHNFDGDGDGIGCE